MKKTQKERVLPSKWYVVNIKAHRDQTPMHYVNVFESVLLKDPIVTLSPSKSASIQQINFGQKDKEGIPTWIELVMMTYTIVDPESFYNKRKKESVKISTWDEDLVVNKRELCMYFIPKIHTLAVRKSGEVSLKMALRYITDVIDSIEPEMFDITVVTNHDTISRILGAYAIVKIDANVSFSNPGHAEDFMGAFDSKLCGMNPKKFHISAVGSDEHPLLCEDDGLLPAIINMSERNGDVKASVIEAEGGKLSIIDTKNYPETFIIRSTASSCPKEIVQYLMMHYGSHF